MDEEIKQELSRVLKSIQIEKKSQNKFIKFFNNPLFITFFGGLLITIITLGLQYQFVQADKERLRLQNRIETMQNTLTTFSDGIIQSLQASFGMRKRSIWLKLHQKDTNKESLFYPDQRNFIETRNFFEKQITIFNRLRHPDSLCAEARAIFHDEYTKKLIDGLDSTLDEYFTTFEFDVLYDSKDNAVRLYERVLESMYKQLEEVYKKENENN